MTYIHILDNIKLEGHSPKVGSNVLARSAKTNTGIKRGVNLNVVEGRTKINTVLGVKDGICTKIQATSNYIASSKRWSVGFTNIGSMVAFTIVGMKSIAG